MFDESITGAIFLEAIVAMVRLSGEIAIDAYRDISSSHPRSTQTKAG